ncbi:MAG TPA: AsmA-like C-terminal region-containing protein [Patescibacteria group bacterium]|nr:AsmA-like C-terminal region-containing protein [Patescibacteria group bacterium]
MTLFNDEEDEEDKAPPSAARRWLKRILLASLVLLLFTWATLRILMGLGGNSETMRQGVEEIFLRSTGLHATIAQFNYMKLYPDVSVDMANITLSEADHGPAAATIGSMKIAADFWDVLSSTGNLRDFDVEKLDIREGYYFRKALHVDKLKLEKDGGPEGAPALVMSGRYGDDPFNGYLVMEWHKDSAKKGFFTRPKKSAFSFTSPFLTFTGELSAHPGGGLNVAFSNLSFADRVFAGNIFFRGESDGTLIKGDIKDKGSEYVPELRYSAGQGYTGSLRLPIFDTADIKSFGAIAALYDVLFPDAKDEAGGKAKADIAVSIDELRINHAKAGQLSFPIKIDGGVVTIGPLKGTVSGGEASGQATLDESKKNFSLTIKALVRDMKYGELQKALFGKESASGKATLDVSLASEAAATSYLIKNLKGEAAFVAAEGDLSAGMLDLWGKSLIETMLPSFGHTQTMKLNCMIADFKFADGQAKADPLFLDSDDMTIAGEGNIALSTDPQIDLLLTPKPKSPVLLSTAVSARVKGPLANPDIGPDNLSLGKKAGGLLLGVVNPAFLVFSLTDLGLNDQHPCHKFLGAKP